MSYNQQSGVFCDPGETKGGGAISKIGIEIGFILWASLKGFALWFYFIIY